jgi:hypothetical protein
LYRQIDFAIQPLEQRRCGSLSMTVPDKKKELDPSAARKGIKDDFASD